MARLTASTHTDLVKTIPVHSSRVIGNNTRASRGGDTTNRVDVYLHDHLIVSLWCDHAEFRMAGYGTVTTRERLNHFLIPLGFRVSQHKGVQQLTRLSDGMTTPIGTGETYTICDDTVILADYFGTIIPILPF